MLLWIRNAFRNVFRKKVRSMLTVSGVAIGVASVLIISSIGEIGKYTINQELDSLGLSGLFIGPEKSVTTKEMTEENLSLVRGRSEVETAIPLQMKYTNAMVRQTAVKCVAWGIPANVADVVSLRVKHGRLISGSDLKSTAEVCVVDESFAEKAYQRTNIVGKTLSVLVGGRYRNYRIVGVVETGGNVMQGLMGDYVPTFVYLPYSTMQQSIGRAGFDQIAVKLKPDVDPDVLSVSLKQALEEQMKLPNAVSVENMSGHKNQLNRILDLVTTILSVIGGIALVVAGLSIMTVMLVSVHERTREIGIKKSIGASRFDILLEFLTESLLITVLGSIAGTAVGLSAVIGGSILLGLDVIVDAQLILFCTVFAVIIGVLFGVYPAAKAANLHPVEALRTE